MRKRRGARGGKRPSTGRQQAASRRNLERARLQRQAAANARRKHGPAVAAARRQLARSIVARRTSTRREGYPSSGFRSAMSPGAFYRGGSIFRGHLAWPKVRAKALAAILGGGR